MVATCTEVKKVVYPHQIQFPCKIINQVMMLHFVIYISFLTTTLNITMFTCTDSEVSCLSWSICNSCSRLLSVVYWSYTAYGNSIPKEDVRRIRMVRNVAIPLYPLYRNGTIMLPMETVYRVMTHKDLPPTPLQAGTWQEKFLVRNLEGHMMP